jgi:hypothetical protein
MHNNHRTPTPRKPPNPQTPSERGVRRQPHPTGEFAASVNHVAGPQYMAPPQLYLSHRLN